MTVVPDQADLAGTPWANWTRTPIAGDASARRYARLTGPDGASVILMEAGPERATQVPRFLAIADVLRQAGLCPPALMFRSEDDALLVIEDLGPWDVARWVSHHPHAQDGIYAAVLDVLIVLSRVAPPDGLVRLDPPTGTQMIAPLFDWALPGSTGLERDRTETTLHDALAAHAAKADTLALRDVHAENLIWRPDRTGTDRIGLLDFQDAMRAPSEYDLVSLLRDARRDIPTPLRARMMAEFAQRTGRDGVTVAAACATLGVQRNLRILGIFARLARRDGKPQYRTLVPRVLAMIDDDLRHPALGDLSVAVRPLLAALS